MKKVDKTIVMRIHWKREMKWNEINKIATYSQNIVSLLVWMIGMDLFAAQFCWIIEWVDECFWIASYLGFETHKHQTFSEGLLLVNQSN